MQTQGESEKSKVSMVRATGTWEMAGKMKAHSRDAHTTGAGGTDPRVLPPCVGVGTMHHPAEPPGRGLGRLV